jgi:hypothetical protein
MQAQDFHLFRAAISASFSVAHAPFPGYGKVAYSSTLFRTFRLKRHTVAVKELEKRCDAVSETMTRVEDVTRKNVRIALLFALVAGMVLMFLCLLAVDWMTGGFRILVSLRG